MLESVPNFSEGRDEDVLAALRSALSSPARLLDVHVDVDHHRSVFTLVGEEAQLVETLLAGIAAARDRIDLRRHSGAHPRIGAADVVPIVPVRPGDMEAARETALSLAQRVGDELELPVFLYADVGAGRAPAFFRRGGVDALQARIDAGELTPDFGPSRLDPRAGGVIVGARRPLIAFNVNLRGELEQARAVAAVVRESGGGFPGVRALGLDLPRAGVVQVSMNVEDWEAAALHDIVDRVASEAEARGAEVLGSELVGLMPAGAAVAAAGSLLRIAGFDASHVLELRLLDLALNPHADKVSPMTTIVVGYDGDDASSRALDRAIDEARTSQGHLVVVAVLEMPLQPEGPQNFGSLERQPGSHDPARRAARARTGVREGTRAGQGGGPERGLHLGCRGSGIGDRRGGQRARRGLIVLGSHHHGLLKRLLGTDVASEVKRSAGCDVSSSVRA